MSRRRQRKKSVPGSGVSGRASLWIAAGLVLAVVAVYGQTSGHDFVNLDDPEYVVENPSVRSGLSWAGIRWAFTSCHESNWHPLTWLSHMADCGLFGLRAGGHHVVNVLLHALNAVLLFGAFRRMTRAVWPSALVAGIFAVHPLRVESVAWVAERKDVLSGTFFMLTLLSYGWYAERPSARRYVLVAASFAIGLLAKPMLVTLPLVLLLLDYWPLERLRPGPSRARGVLVLEKIPLFALSAASSVVTLLCQRSGGSVSTLEEIPLSARLANAGVAYVAYLWKTVWPAKLAVLYPHPALSAAGRGSLVVAGLAGAALIAALTLAALRYARRRPYVPVGWLWYLGTLVPVVGVVQVGTQAHADRYAYVTLVGIYLIVAWGLVELLRIRPRAHGVVVAVCVGGLVALSAAAWVQAGRWRDSRTLFEHTLRVTRNNFVAHNNLGLTLEGQGDVPGATAHYESALRIRPDHAKAHVNLGRLLSAQGRLTEAVARYETALRYDPRSVEAINNLGVALVRLGDLSRAAEAFERSIRLRPDLADTRGNLAVVRMRQGRLAEAREQLTEALRLDPANAVARENLADLETLIRQHGGLEPRVP